MPPAARRKAGRRERRRNSLVGLGRASDILPVDLTNAFPNRRWRPADGSWHRGIDGHPAPFDIYFGINVAVSVRLVGPESCQDQPDRVSGGNQHRPQQNRQVVAVAGPQLEHSPRRMQQFGPENVAGVTDVPAYPVEQRQHLARAVLGAYPVVAEDLDGLLPNVEILRALANQSPNEARSNQRARRTLGYPVDSNARYDESTAKLNHSQGTEYALHS